MGFTQALTIRFADQDQERWRRNVEAQVRELQTVPAASLVVLSGVELADGIETKIAHRLGRRPVLTFPSFVRGAITTGRIDEGDSADPTKYLVLTANGWGATITIDIGVL